CAQVSDDGQYAYGLFVGDAFGDFEDELFGFESGFLPDVEQQVEFASWFVEGGGQAVDEEFLGFSQCGAAVNGEGAACLVEFAVEFGARCCDEEVDAEFFGVGGIGAAE